MDIERTKKQTADKKNGDTQRQLAEKLVRTMGLEGAIQVARDNHWEGVLKEIPFVAGLGD